jgi:DNA-binding IclR family transcriptional regulator
MSTNRTSPAVERSLDVLNFLAEHESETFTLSDLSRRLNLAKATGHTILATLVKAGYVSRNAHRRYCLGPAVIALGEAASGQNRAVALGQEAAAFLATELGLECLLTAVVEDAILVVGKTRIEEPRGELLVLPVARRIPLVPPIGAIFVAWWDDERLRCWLDEVTASWEAGRCRRFVSSLEVVRRRGYSVSAIASDSIDRVRTLLASVDVLSDESDLADTFDQFLDQAQFSEGYMVGDLVAGQRYDLSSMAAPVFDRAGDVVLAMTLKGFSCPVDRAEIESMATSLLRAAQSVTDAIGGRRPIDC